MNAVSSSYAASMPGAAPPFWTQKHPLHFTYEERVAYADTFKRIPPELLRQGGCRRLVRPDVFPVLARLSQNAMGASYATESSLRLMLWINNGGFPHGARSVSRCLRQENERGEVERRRYPRGHHFREIDYLSKHGTTTNRLPSEKERRQRLYREKMAKRAQRRERARAEKALRREPTRLQTTTTARAPATDAHRSREGAQKLVEREPDVTETPARGQSAKEPRTALPQAMRDFILRQDFLRPPPSAEPIGILVRGEEDFEARKAQETKRAEAWMAAEGEKPRKKPPD